MEPVSVVLATSRTPDGVLDRVTALDGPDAPPVLRLDTSVRATRGPAVRLHAAGLRDNVVVVSEDIRYEPMVDNWTERATPSGSSGAAFGISTTARRPADPCVRVTVWGESPGRIIEDLIEDPATTGVPLGLVAAGLVAAMPMSHDEVQTLIEPQRLPSGTLVLLWRPPIARVRRMVESVGIAETARTMGAHWKEAEDVAQMTVRDHGVYLPVGIDPARSSPELVEALGLRRPLTENAWWLGVVTDENRWEQVLSGDALTRTATIKASRAAAAAHTRYAMADGGYHAVMLHGLLGRHAQTAPVSAPAEDEHAQAVASAAAATARAEAEVERLKAVIAAREASLRAARRELASVHRLLDRYEHPDEDDTDDETEILDAPTVADEPRPDPDRPEPAVEPATPSHALALSDGVLPHVVVTEHARECARALDEHGKASVWARRTWRILADLNAYAARRAQYPAVANFRAFLAHLDHPGTNARQVAVRESDTVMASDKMRSERVRPVPRDVDPSGTALLVEHVRIESGGKPPAPRLYFYDDTAGTTGKVVVGYVGPHLTNTRTS